MKPAKDVPCVPANNILQARTIRTIQELLNSLKDLNVLTNTNGCRKCECDPILIRGLESLIADKEPRVRGIAPSECPIIWKLCARCESKENIRLIHNRFLSLWNIFCQQRRRDGGITFLQELGTWIHPYYIWFKFLPQWLKVSLCCVIAFSIACAACAFLFWLLHATLHLFCLKLFAYTFCDDSTVMCSLFVFSIVYFSFLCKNIYPHVPKLIGYVIEEVKFGHDIHAIILRLRQRKS